MLPPTGCKWRTWRRSRIRRMTRFTRNVLVNKCWNRLFWSNHLNIYHTTTDDRLPKRAAELREQGRRRRGRPRLRWEDCVKRDVRKTGEEEDWKKKTRDRGGWKILSDEAVKKLRAAPHPWQRETRKREREVLSVICRLPSHSWLCIPGLLFLVIQYKLVFSYRT